MEEKRGPWGEGAAAPVLDSGGCGGRGEKMGVDEVLRLHAGEFGRWQLKHFVLTSTAWALEAFHTMVMIFADREPAWRCIAGAGGASCRAASAGGAAAAGLCGLPAGSWELGVGRGSGGVDGGRVGPSLRSQVQGRARPVFLLRRLHAGAGVFGHLSDSFMGRKGALTVVCALNAVFGLLTALSPSFWVYAVLRVLTGFSTGGIGLCAFVLATEPVGPSKRGVAGMSTFYFFSGGIAALSGAAFLFRSWRVLYVVTSLPSVVFLLTVLPFISESPRWYLIRRRITEAMDVLREIAQSNGNGDLVGGIALTVDGDSTAEEEDAVSGTLVDVVRSPVSRIRLVLAVLITLLCAVIYYGLSLNVVNLRTSLYLSVFLNAVAEMPAFLLTAALLDRFGRRPLAVATMWLSGAFCLAGAAVGGGTTGAWEMLRLACGVMGIFGMAATYNLLFIYTAELFPTVVRNAALGCTTQASHLGAILAPLVVVLGEKVPFAVFGACGVAGGLVALYLPETMNKPLYDTLGGMEEGESNGKGRIKV
ncbi:unnamed protein product [Spirodela intermedia]|uniref:H(+)/Pi cotransporter n=1 Tax=Spirodela intermedia TaxID=51605 RepID=A0A7I8KB77_SPIIN|nr:unnamed protein product [Spirodela intermedia]